MKVVDHPGVGRLERRRGRWRGTIRLGDEGDVPLVLSGGRSGPDESAAEGDIAFDLAVARALVCPCGRR